MRHVEITMLKGRTTEQKRRVAERITQALMEEAGARREATSIAIVEVEQDSFAHGGVLVIDDKR